MAKEMNLTIGIGVAAAGALTALASVSKSMSKFNEQQKKISAELEKKKSNEIAIKNIEKLQKAYTSVGKEWIEATTKLRKMREAYEQNGKSNEKLARKIQEQEKVVEKLNKQKEAQKHTFERARSSIEAEHGSLKKYKESVDKVNKSLEKQEKIKKSIEKHKKFADIGNKVSSFSAKGLALTAIPIKTYIDIEESQADLRKMLGDEAKKYYKDLREISDKSPLSQPEVFEIAGSLAQSGIQSNQIVEYTKMANKLKVTFDIGTNEAGEFLAKTKEQLGLTKQQVFDFADTINYMADNTASSAAQLVEFSNRIGGVARTMNVSKEANIAFGATLISMGKAPEIAATGIKQLYLELGKGADTKKKQAAFDFLGLDSKNIARDMAKDAEGTIIKVLEKINKLKTKDKAGILNDLFGEQAIDSVATLANNTDKLRENLEKVKSTGSKGAVDKEYENRMDTPLNKLKVSANKVQNTFGDIGEALAPLITQALEKLNPILESMANFIKNNPELTKMIAQTITLGLTFGFVGGKIFSFTNKFREFKAGLNLAKEAGTLGNFGKILLNILTPSKWLVGLKSFGGRFITPILNNIKGLGPKLLNGLTNGLKGGLKFGKLLGSGLIKGFLGIIKVVRMLGLAMKTAFLANPVVAIIAAIIAVIVILVVLYKKNKKFRDFVNKMWKAISTWAVNSWNKIKETALVVWNGVNKGISNFVSSFKEKISSIVNFFKDKWNSIKNFATNNPISKAIGGIGKALGIGQNYTGTKSWRGGLTTVAERGAELIKIPGQQAFVAQHEMLMDLPRGTQILNNSETMKALMPKSNNENSLGKELSKGLSLKDGVEKFKNTISNTNKTNIGGDTISVTINAGSQSNPEEIARLVCREIEKMKNHKYRTEIA